MYSGIVAVTGTAAYVSTDHVDSVEAIVEGTVGDRDGSPGVDVSAWPWRGAMSPEGVARIADEGGAFLVGDERGHAFVAGSVDEAVAWAVAPAANGPGIAWAVWAIDARGGVAGEAVASGIGWDYVLTHRRSDAIGIGGWQWRAAVNRRRDSAYCIVAYSSHDAADSRETFAFASAVDAAEWAMADYVGTDYGPIVWAHLRLGEWGSGWQDTASHRAFRIVVITYGRGGDIAVSSRYTLAEAIDAYGTVYAPEYPRNQISIVHVDETSRPRPARRPLMKRAEEIATGRVDG